MLLKSGEILNIAHREVKHRSFLLQNLFSLDILPLFSHSNILPIIF